MINTSFMRLLGAPVEIRARRLAKAFLGQTKRVADVQRELLLRRVAQHADSQFGRDHHFAEIRTPADFRRRVPIGGIWAARLSAGEVAAPVRQPICGGSSLGLANQAACSLAGRQREGVRRVAPRVVRSRDGEKSGKARDPC